MVIQLNNNPLYFWGDNHGKWHVLPAISIDIR